MQTAALCKLEGAFSQGLSPRPCWNEALYCPLLDMPCYNLINKELPWGIYREPLGCHRQCRIRSFEWWVAWQGRRGWRECGVAGQGSSSHILSPVLAPPSSPAPVPSPCLYS